MREVEALAETFLTTVPECLPYTKFREFLETGERTSYEDTYFSHRKRLNSLFFSYVWSEDEKYLDPLLDAIFAVLDEFTWSVPAHQRGRDTVESKIGKIDLFAAETAYALSEIYNILGDTLPPLIRERIRFEVERRIVTPFFSQTENYPSSNWSAVQSSGIIASLVHVFPERLEEALSILCPIIENFLVSYNEDGCCMEGSLYWIYGFGFFVYGTELLRDATGGKVDYLKGTKVENMAHFFEKITFKNGYVVPFADSPLQCKMRIGLACFLHREFGAELPDSDMLFAVSDDTRFRFADILHDLYWGEDFDTAGKVMLGEHYFPDAGWYIYRTEHFAYAAKGGHNMEPHNHNDVGNFVFFDGEKTVLGDLGWEEYVRTYFGPRRYLDFLLTPSSGHAVPKVDEKEQIVLAEKAEVVEAKDGVFAVDIGKAYGVDRFLRRIEATEHGIIVTDTSDHPFTERFITGYRPERIGNCLTVGGVRVELDCPATINITGQTYRPRRIICGEHLKEVETAYLVEFIPETPKQTIRMTITKQ